MLGRLRRTARFIATTTYANRDEALAMIDHVRRVHAGVSGTLADGMVYTADDPHLLAWVHTSEAWSFLTAWQSYGDHTLCAIEQDRYYSDFALISTAIGAHPVPANRDGIAQVLRHTRRELSVDSRTREVARLVLGHMPDNPLAIPLQRITMQAAIDLLPDWARRMHGLSPSPMLFRPVVGAGAMGLVNALQWAFSKER